MSFTRNRDGEGYSNCFWAIRAKNGVASSNSNNIMPEFKVACQENVIAIYNGFPALVMRAKTRNYRCNLLLGRRR